MSVLILNAWPKILVDFDQWLAPIKDDLVMFTLDRYAESFPELPRVYGFENYTHNGNVELRAMELHHTDPITRILALDEADILRAGRLRSRLDVCGQTEKSAMAFRDKVLMKQYIRKANIPCAEFQYVQHAVELSDFAAKYGLPIVVKPVDGMGSIGVKILRSNNEIADFVVSGIPTGYMVETFIDGKMYEVDGLVVEGQLAFSSVGYYVDDCMAFNSGGTVFTEILNPSEPVVRRLKEFVSRVLDALPTPEYTVFHAEIFEDRSGEMVFNEIASRSAGARITECIRATYGVHLDKSLVQATCGLVAEDLMRIEATPKHLAASYLIPKQTGTLESHVDVFPFPWVVEYQPRVKPGAQVKPAQHSVDTIGSVVFLGKDHDELMARYETLRDYVAQHVRWRFGDTED